MQTVKKQNKVPLSFKLMAKTYKMFSILVEKGVI